MKHPTRSTPSVRTVYPSRTTEKKRKKYINTLKNNENRLKIKSEHIKLDKLSISATNFLRIYRFERTRSFSTYELDEKPSQVNFTHVRNTYCTIYNIYTPLYVYTEYNLNRWALWAWASCKSCAHSASRYRSKIAFKSFSANSTTRTCTTSKLILFTIHLRSRRKLFGYIMEGVLYL